MIRAVKRLKQAPNSDVIKNKLSDQLSRISKRLGIENFKRINKQLQIAFQKDSIESHHIWIHELLTNYYDKMYHYQLEKKKDRCIFSGKIMKNLIPVLICIFMYGCESESDWTYLFDGKTVKGLRGSWCYVQNKKIS